MGDRKAPTPPPTDQVKPQPPPPPPPFPSGPQGMSLRDYFAGLALATVVTEALRDYEWLAEHCYEIADAMLQERSK